MAKCRCGICKSRREPVVVGPASPADLHQDRRVYKMTGGHLLQEGLDAIILLFKDFTHASFKTKISLDMKVLESYFVNRPVWRQYVEQGREFSVSNIFWEYLSKAGVGWSESNICPDELTAQAHDAESRLKNVRQVIRRWVRWYTDRTHPIKEPNLGWRQFALRVGSDWVNKDGKWTSRLSSALYKEGIKLTKDQLETVANTLDKYVMKDGEYEFSFDTGFVSGRPEEYCHAGSCWWGGYSRSRALLAANGGHACRVWSGKTPIARCWIAPVKSGGYVVFNAYGKLQLSGFAQILSQVWGMKMGAVSLTYPSTMYVNNASGFHLHPEEPLTQLSLDWTENRNIPYIHPSDPCAICGESLAEMNDGDGDFGGLCWSCFRSQSAYASRPVEEEAEELALNPL